MITIDEALEVDNVAELIDDEALAEIGSLLKSQIEDDDESRSQWIEAQSDWLKQNQLATIQIC